MNGNQLTNVTVENIITQSLELVHDEQNFTQVLTEVGSPVSKSNSDDIDNLLLFTPPQRQLCSTLPLSPKCKALYDSVINAPKDEFITKLIESTKHNKCLLDQFRNDLYQIAKGQAGFPSGSLVKRQRHRREEKLASDCYLIHMFLNGDTSDDILSVISASGRSTATPVVSRPTQVPAPINLAEHIGSLNASVADIEARTGNVEERITVFAKHFVRMLQEVKEGKLAEIDGAVHNMTFIIDEVGNKITNQGKTLASLKDKLCEMEYRIDQSDANFQNSLSDVSRLTDVLNEQRALYQEISDKHDSDRNHMKCEIKLIRKSLKTVEESVSCFKQMVDSTTTSISYLRKQVIEVQDGKSHNRVNDQPNYSDIVKSNGSGQDTLSLNVASVVACSAPKTPRCIDLPDNETLSFKDKNMSLKERSAGLNGSYVELQSLLPGPSGTAGRDTHLADGSSLQKPNQKFKQQTQAKEQVRSTEDRMVGAPIQVVSSRMFYSNSPKKFYVGNIVEGITSYQIESYMKKKNVRCTGIKMLPSKSVGKIGAQITVNKNADMKRILDSNFWPENVYARRWFDSSRA